jgi:hypothetical protein
MLKPTGDSGSGAFNLVLQSQTLQNSMMEEINARDIGANSDADYQELPDDGDFGTSNENEWDLDALEETGLGGTSSSSTAAAVPAYQPVTPAATTITATAAAGIKTKNIRHTPRASGAAAINNLAASLSGGSNQNGMVAVVQQVIQMMMMQQQQQEARQDRLLELLLGQRNQRTRDEADRTYS